jgi:uncharacterized damage-inducible protein DinB
MQAIETWRKDMEAKDFVIMQLISLREQAVDTIKETTDEQLNWTPPGTANSIKATYLHLVSCEDIYIQEVLQGKPLVWETGTWNQKIGLKDFPGAGDGWVEIQAANLTLTSLIDYDLAVQSATRAYIDKLNGYELSRLVKFYDELAPTAAVLAFLVIHSSGHLGEIAAIKGIQGGKGLPY